MNALLVSDLHLTSSPRDEYRWRLFPWLREQIVKHSVQSLVVLGDLTEAKDYHSARLVNRIVDELAKLCPPSQPDSLTIHLLRGNHDGTDPECPYFRFLRWLPFVTYYAVPQLRDLHGRRVLFLPHTQEPERWEQELLRSAEVIFMHQTVSGAVSETGAALEGIALTALDHCRAKIWSGDLHVPQRVGPVEYVGAPYPVRFGDRFKPRAVLLENELRKARDLEPPRFGRPLIVIDDPEQRTRSIEEEIRAATAPGDQVKVRVRLTRAQLMLWDQLRRAVLAACSQAEVELCGLEVERLEERPFRIRLRNANPPSTQTPQRVLAVWCERRGIEPPVAEAGQQLLQSTLTGEQ